MRLLRYGSPGTEKPGIVDEAGKIRDLGVLLADIEGRTLHPESFKRLRAVEPTLLPLIEDAGRLGPPVHGIGNVIAVGVNYRGHAAYTKLPNEPFIFSKHTGAVCGPNDPILIPPGATKVDWEVELAVIIGEPARRVPIARALDHVAGYTIGNDVSERDFQSERGGQFIKGKSWENFCPLGPWLVTADEVPDVQDLTLWLNVNGERMQESSTADMVFSVAELISYVSHFMILQPGDVMLTGTPPGVGMTQGRYLRAGDIVRLGIVGLGEQCQTVMASHDAGIAQRPERGVFSGISYGAL